MRQPLRSVTSLAAVAGAALLSGGLVAAPAAADTATCSDVEVIFARGTGELRGLGSVGRPFVEAVTAELSGLSVTSYAVDYAANISQTSSGPGSTDMVERIQTVAAACPGTRFIIGGYSQGATVTTKAVGASSGFSSGTVIPDELADRVAAVVVFGNPLGKVGGTIASKSEVYGPRSKDYCATGDAVCDSTGMSWVSHASYGVSGLVGEGATFAADLVRAGSAPIADPTAPPAPAEPPAPAAPPAPAPAPDPATGTGSSWFQDFMSSWGSGSGWGSGWGKGSSWGSGWDSAAG